MKRKVNRDVNATRSASQRSKGALEDAPRHSLRSWPILLLLFVLICAVYWPVSTQDFTLWDDIENLVENPDFNPPSWRSVLHYWTNPARGLYVPVTYTVWQLVALVPGQGVGTPPDSPLNPHAFHLVNLLIHVLSVWAVFLLLKSVLRAVAVDAKAAGWAAFAGALLFGLHPVQVEPVAWVSGTKDVLCGLFTIIAVRQYVGYVHAAPAEDRVPSWPKVRHPRYLAAAAAFVMAMFAKPTGVVMPLIAGGIVFFALKRPFRQVVADMAPLLVLSGVFVLLNKSAQQHNIGYPVSFEDRLCIAGDAISFYLGKLLVPVKLCFHHGRTPRYWKSQQYLIALLPCVLAGGIAAIMWMAKSTREPLRWLLAGAAVFVAGVLPVLGLVVFMYQRLSTVADHYLYLSMLGPALVLARLLAAKRGVGWRLAAAAWLCALGILAAFQVPTWKNSKTLLRHAIAVNPRSWVAYNNLSKLAKDKGHFEEAAEWARKALEIQPEYSHAHVNLGLALIDMGRLEEGTAHLNEARRIEPVMRQFIHIAAEAKCALADQCEKEGDLAQAAVLYREALQIKPDYFEARFRLGICLKNNGQFDQAEMEFAKALKLKPDDALTHFNLGIALERRKKVEQALEQYREAVRLDPALAEAHHNLGAAYHMRGDLDRAAEHYEKALAHAPDTAQTHFNLALVFEARKETEQAIEHYRETVRLDPACAEAHNRLGLLYEARGDLALAAVHYEKALEHAPGMVQARDNLQRVREQIDGG